MNSKLLSIWLILTMFSVVVLTAPIEPVSAKLFHDKLTMTKMWKDLCDAHPTLASYESIGKSIQDQNIWLFKIGNPHGGAIMWDEQIMRAIFMTPCFWRELLVPRLGVSIGILVLILTVTG